MVLDEIDTCIKSDDQNKLRHYFRGDLYARKQAQFSGSRSLRQHPRSFNVLGVKVSDTRHQTVLKMKNVLYVVKLIHTKTVQIKKKGSRNA